MEYCPEEATLTNSAVAPGKLHSFVLHLDTGKCEGEGEVDQASVEFPTTHPYRHGHTNTRYSYLMASDRGSNVPYRDVIKVCSGGALIIRMSSLRTTQLAGHLQLPCLCTLNPSKVRTPH